MIVEPFEKWWCCLGTPEKSALSALVPFWFINPSYVGRATFDAIVTLSGVAASTQVLAYFVQHYSLEYQLIPCGEDCWIDAVVWTDEFWPLLYAFAQTDEFICDGPCKLRTFPL